jgi:hypothetical protein
MRGRRAGKLMRLAHCAALGGCLSMLAGCAGLDTQSVEGPCLDDSKACVGERTQMVQALSSDPSRGWIGQPAGRGIVASGVRLFAYQNVRDKLSCPELTSGIAEMNAAKQILTEGPAPGQTMLRHNQIKAMTEDVRAALLAGRSRKCPGGASAQG